jgi:hypothetical protein
MWSRDSIPSRMCDHHPHVALLHQARLPRTTVFSATAPKAPKRYATVTPAARISTVPAASAGGRR